MYAIVSIAGQQFKVEKDKKIFVHRLSGEAGAVKEFDKVILIDNEGKVTLGNPYINNALVTAKIVSHIKGDKVLIFKKKKRKGYQKMNGHRQHLTEIIIDEILENTAARKAVPVPEKEKKQEPVKTKPVAETTTVAEKTAVSAKPKKPAVKKAGQVKPAVKKAEKVKPKVENAGKKTTAKAKTDAGKETKAKPKAKSGAGKAKTAAPKAKSEKKQSEDKK